VRAFAEAGLKAGYVESGSKAGGYVL